MRSWRDSAFFLFCFHAIVQGVFLMIFYVIINYCTTHVGFVFTIGTFIFNALALLVMSSVTGILLTLFLRRKKKAFHSVFWMAPVFLLPLPPLIYILSENAEYTILIFAGGIVLSWFFAWISHRAMKRKLQ